MRNREIDAESRAASAEIVEDSAKATTMLEGMLGLARADIEPVDITMEAVDLCAIVNESCAMARALATEREIMVTKHLEEPALLIAGNATSLKRLLWILLDNTLKYKQPRGMVSVSIRRAPSSVLMTVSDNGMGIRRGRPSAYLQPVLSGRPFTE